MVHDDGCEATTNSASFIYIPSAGLKCNAKMLKSAWCTVATDKTLIIQTNN